MNYYDTVDMVERITELEGHNARLNKLVEELQDRLSYDLVERIELLEAQSIRWRPIAFAPKDGTYVLCWESRDWRDEEGVAVKARYVTDTGWLTDHEDPQHIHPTHFAEIHGPTETASNPIPSKV